MTKENFETNPSGTKARLNAAEKCVKMREEALLDLQHENIKLKKEINYYTTIPKFTISGKGIILIGGK